MGLFLVADRCHDSIGNVVVGRCPNFVETAYPNGFRLLCLTPDVIVETMIPNLTRIPIDWECRTTSEDATSMGLRAIPGHLAVLSHRLNDQSQNSLA